ncbi:unnamed protein product [Cylicostephanus goldi]|uniref:Uncharacterized protein n=1 Tax=Cylicostephanus goldi TaxID=71465 RepID=A0A3P7PTD2_CYLGO|nr:unnamed protein product [Cylicostephanus goldi]
MRGLVDYGSDSGSEAEEDNTPKDDDDTTNSLPTPHPPLPKVDGQADSYFDADDVFDGSSSLNLPSVIETGVSLAAEGELEDIVKPKEWELKMAEKEKRRREKKAKRKQKKEKKKEKEDEKSAVETLPVIHGKPKGKAKIAAFGALSAIADGVSSDSDEEQKSESVSAQSKPKGSGLLAMLPTPKGKSRINLGNVSGKGNGVLLPPSLRNKTKPTPAVKVNLEG